MRIHKIPILLCFVMFLSSFTLHTQAAANDRITDISSPLDQNATFHYDSIQPETVFHYPLTAEMFSWSGSPGTPGDPVTRAQLRSANISVQYSSNQSKVVKDATLGTTTYGGKETACVKLEFAEELVSVDSVDFSLTLYLTMGSTRKNASSITIKGTMENDVIEIDASYDYVSIQDGQVLTSSDYISELEIYLSKNVTLYTRIQSGSKYYARAKTGLQNADSSMISKYPEIETAVRIYSINIIATGSYISLNNMGTYYVYSSNGTYLGTTDERLPFHDLYYLASEKITMTSNNNGSDSSAGGVSDKTPEEKAAQEEMAGAAADAASTGSASADVRVKDVEKVSAGELQAMFDAAAAAKMKSKYIADTVSLPRNTVQGRITINPALAKNLKDDIYLGVYTDSSNTAAVESFMKQHYTNNIAVVYLTHKGSYHMTVRITAKIKTTDIDQQNLNFYSYDKTTNKIKRIKQPNYAVSEKGYVHFDTIYGDYIIVSVGALSRK